MKVSLNGSIINGNQASVKAETDGLFYGAGCFETLTSYSGKFLHLERHIKRLNDGAVYLTGLEEEFFHLEVIRNNILELLEANALTNTRSRVRIQYSITERLGYTQSVSKPISSILITVGSVPEIPADSYHLSTVDTTVVPASSRPVNLKLSNMLHYREAAIKAKKTGADDALMLTINGHIAETAIANIFWEKDGTVFTPSDECDILPGITRTIVMEIIRCSGGQVKSGRFYPDELNEASQVWLCNSVREIASVTQIDKNMYPANSEFINSLIQDFENYKKNNLT